MAFQRLLPLRKLLAVFVLVLLLAACGGDSEPEETNTNDPDLGLSTSDELGSKLLTQDDMPPDWEPVDPNDEDASSELENGFCNQPVPDTEGSTGTAMVQFYRGELTTRVVETVTSYEDDARATEIFSGLEETTRTCKEWDVVAEDVHTRLQLTALEFPNLADQTVAARVGGEFTVPIDGKNGPSTFPGFIDSENVIMRSGNLIVVIHHFVIGIGERETLDSTATEPIARAAAERAK